MSLDSPKSHSEINWPLVIKRIMCSVVGGPGKRYRGGDTQWAERGKNSPLNTCFQGRITPLPEESNPYLQKYISRWIHLQTATFDQNHIHSTNRQPPGVAGVSKDSMLAEEVWIFMIDALFREIWYGLEWKAPDSFFKSVNIGDRKKFYVSFWKLVPSSLA